MLTVRVKYNRVFKYRGVTYFGTETISMPKEDFNSGMLDMVDVMDSRKTERKPVTDVVVDEELGDSPVTDDSVVASDRAKAGEDLDEEQENEEQENEEQEEDIENESSTEDQEPDEEPKKKSKKHKKNKK